VAAVICPENDRTAQLATDPMLAGGLQQDFSRDGENLADEFAHGAIFGPIRHHDSTVECVL
jgi:hypothetical protein